MSRIPFSVYDFFGYLSAGSVVVATTDYLYGQKWLIEKDIGATLAGFVVVLCYVVGHAHAVSHVASLVLESGLVGKLLKSPTRALMGEGRGRVLGTVFPGYYRALPVATRERIREQAKARGFTDDGEGIFLHAYGIVTKSDKAQGRLDEFRNLYGFARNMAFAFFVVAGMFALDDKTPPTFWWAAVAAALGVTMLYRYLKFIRQFAYQLFVAYAELERPSGEREST